jgi:hypothetical protein
VNNLHLLFAILVVLGFAFHLVATWPAPWPAARLAWACWLIAAILWAMGAA